MGEAARSPSRTGRVIAGRYRIIKLLGRGGMAEVFLVEKVSEIERAKKLFALKRILPQYADDPMRVSCFLDEVAVAATIDHPNIVHAHDWGQDEDAGGSLFLVMDFVRGMDLYRLGDKLAEKAREEGALYPGQERGILPVHVVAWAILQCAIGLDYLHQQKRREGDELGLIHRDISPDNIMIDIRGHVRINDLGIAKALKGEQSQASATKHATGKPLYMPPEQWKGLPIDGTADLYALGITTFELLTRRHPYDNPALPHEDVMNKVVRAFHTDRRPIAELAPEIPAPMQRMLEQLIRGNRAERQQSAAELYAPLKETIASFGLDLHQAQQEGGELTATVYLPPDTIQSARAVVPEALQSDSPPAESEKRPISRPPEGSTARAKPPARTTPLGEVVADAPPPATAPFAVAQPEAPSSSRSLKLAVAASLVLLLGLVSFGVAFFAWPGSSDPQVGPPASPEPTTTTAPATSTAPPPAPAAVAPGPAESPPPAPSDPPPAPVAPAQVAPATPSEPAPAHVEPAPAAPPTQQPSVPSTPHVRPQPRLTPVPVPRMAPVPAPATRNRNDTSARQGDFGI